MARLLMCVVAYKLICVITVCEVLVEISYQHNLNVTFNSIVHRIQRQNASYQLPEDMHPNITM
jgi:hypothetical protein